MPVLLSFVNFQGCLRLRNTVSRVHNRFNRYTSTHVYRPSSLRTYETKSTDTTVCSRPVISSVCNRRDFHSSPTYARRRNFRRTRKTSSDSPSGGSYVHDFKGLISCNVCYEFGKLQKEIDDTLRCMSCGAEHNVEDMYICFKKEEDMNEPANDGETAHQSKLLRPREMKFLLDDHIIGQNMAKKAMSVAVYNHFKRIRNTSPPSDDTGKKSLLARPQMYKIGNKSYINPLYDPSKPRWRAVEATPKLTPGSTSTSTSTSTSSSILTAECKHVRANVSEDGKDVVVGEKFSAITEIGKTNILLFGPTGTGKTLIVKTIAKALDVPFVVHDCTALTQAGYAGEDVQSVISALLKYADYDVALAQRGIIFLDELDKLSRKPDVRRDVSGEGVQHGLLKLLEGMVVDVTVKRRSEIGEHMEDITYSVDTTNIMFVGSGAFTELPAIVERRTSPKTIGFHNEETCKSERQAVLPVDLVEYGFIPELVGRFPVLVGLDALTKSDLIRVMCEPRNAILEQYRELMAMDDVRLCVMDGALEEIATECLQKKLNARGLRSVLERVLLEPMYEVPGSDIIAVIIDRKDVTGETTPALVRKQHKYPTSNINENCKDKAVGIDNITSDEVTCAN
eukprot:CFRG8521T1